MREIHRHCLWATVIVALGAAIARWALGDVVVFGIDDANITHAYARNLAASLGPVFYPGGPAVEGSTSTLWTLLATGVWLLFGPSPAAFVGVCLALSGLSVFLAFRIWAHVRRMLGLDAAIGEAGVAIVFLCTPAWFAWNVWTLMDIAVWTTLLSFAVLMTMRLTLPLTMHLTGPGDHPPREAWIAAASHAALAACRPEGAALSIGLLGVAALAAVASGRKDQENASRLRRLLASALAGLATFGVLTLGRILLFGHPLPNTFYAKAAEDPLSRIEHGLAYTLHSMGALQALRVGAGSAAILLALRLWARRRDPRGFMRDEGGLLVLLASIFGIIATSTLAGGDHFEFQRFFQPALPALAVSIAAAAALLAPEAVRRSRSALVSAAVVGGALTWLSAMAFSQRDELLGVEFAIANDGRTTGDAFNRIASTSGEPVSVGVVAAGGFGLTYNKGPVYDLLGLNWPAMAHGSAPRGSIINHAAFDAAIFWQASPDALMSGAQLPAGRAYVGWFEDAVLKGLYGDQRFREGYRPFVLQSGRPRLVFLSGAWLARQPRLDPLLTPLEWSDIEIGVRPLSTD